MNTWYLTFLSRFVKWHILYGSVSVLLALRLARLWKRELILVLFVRLFDLCLFGFVGLLLLLVSGKGCGLWLRHSLDFSLTFFWWTFLFAEITWLTVFDLHTLLPSVVRQQMFKIVGMAKKNAVNCLSMHFKDLHVHNIELYMNLSNRNIIRANAWKVSGKI